MLLTEHQRLTFHLSPSLSSESITERPHLRASYSSLLRCLQKTQKRLHGASNWPQRREEGHDSSPCSYHHCSGNELRQKHICLDFALGHIGEFIAQIAGNRANLSGCLHRVSPHHTGCFKTALGQIQGDVMLGLSCKSCVRRL